MQISDFSLWGIIPILLLFVVALALFWVADRRLLGSVFRNVGFSAKGLRRLRSKWRPVLAVAGGLVVAVTIVTAALMLCLPLRLLLPVAAVLALAVCENIGSSARAYIRCFNNTQAHRYYMLANGASLMESLVPSLRRALRAYVLPQARRRGLPLALKAALIFLALIMGGATAGAALLTTLLLCIASFVVVVIATLTTAFLLKKLNICC